MTENHEIVFKKKSTIVDDDENTHLHHSAVRGYEDDIVTDLSNEAICDAENYLGWTPLMMACRNGHVKGTELLLEHHADATKKNKYGMSVFLISIAGGSIDIVKLILQHLLCGGVSKQSIQNIFSPISLAVLFSNLEITMYLLQQNFNKNALTPVTGITPLMFAAAMEDTDAFNLLLRVGADPSIKSHLGYSAQDILLIKSSKKNNSPCEMQQQLQISTLITQNIPQAQNCTQTIHPQNVQHSHYNQQIPYILVSPQPSFLQFGPNLPINASKNSFSPLSECYCQSPNFSPITPLNFIPHLQAFFPHDFSPSQYLINSPISCLHNNSNDLLNTKIDQGNTYLSPKT